MGYRIDYAIGAGTVEATLSGKSSIAHATWMARDIADEATRSAARQLLIDVRGLAERVGTLCTLVLGACTPFTDYRVAVVDSTDNAPYHVFSEEAARGRGCELRYFRDRDSAMRWLHADER